MGNDMTDIPQQLIAGVEGGMASTSVATERVSKHADLPTRHGNFRIHIFRDLQGREHVVIYLGDITRKTDVVLRIHSQCMTSEVFGCQRCDCRQQLDAALHHIATVGQGIVIYLRQEGRGIGLFNKIEAYALQDGGLDTVAANHHLGFPSDCRTFEAAVEVLQMLEIESVQLMTNNPRKLQWLDDHGIHVSRRIPLHVEAAELKQQHIK